MWTISVAVAGRCSLNPLICAASTGTGTGCVQGAGDVRDRSVAFRRRLVGVVAGERPGAEAVAAQVLRARAALGLQAPGELVEDGVQVEELVRGSDAASQQLEEFAGEGGVGLAGRGQCHSGLRRGRHQIGAVDLSECRDRLGLHTEGTGAVAAVEDHDPASGTARLDGPLDPLIGYGRVEDGVPVTVGDSQVGGETLMTLDAVAAAYRLKMDSQAHEDTFNAARPEDEKSHCMEGNVDSGCLARRGRQHLRPVPRNGDRSPGPLVPLQRGSRQRIRHARYLSRRDC
ncbi:hypothetical protein [Streptomyces lycii]|uniref:Uncharacterized protein n=1 Tax=Streptomyces lycii TaxID=2654337 RepID=A0ABQ7FG21_9ACTN|nr:hypothetical protein [Streptomyces lycii]KAF4407951.1 hypothetical protein GCU69_16365 [Streptomyces lycii]